MRNTIVSILVLGFLASCAESDPTPFTNDVTIDPTTTRGSIVGQVENLLGEPIVGATVTVPVKDGVRKTVTGPDGRFALDNLPGGSSLDVRIEAEGYLPARTTAVIPNSAGRTPIDRGIAVVGPLALLKGDGRVEFELVGKDGSLLEAPSGSCSVEGTWIHLEDGDARGNLTVAAKFEDGRMVCDGLPNLGEFAMLEGVIAFRFEKIDVDGDGHWDYRGTDGYATARDLFLEGTHVHRIWLTPRESDPVTVVASNVPHLMLEPVASRPVPAARGVEILFSAPVVVHHASIVEEGNEERPAFETQVDGAMVRLVPDGGPWPEGQLLTLDLRIAPLSEPLAVHSFGGVFLTSASAPPTVTASFVDADSNGELDATEVLVIEFSQYISSVGDPLASLYFELDLDLDGSGVIGDAEGEYGASDEFRASSDPGSRYQNLVKRFTHSSIGLIHPGAIIEPGTEVVIRFDRQINWGSASHLLLTEELRTTLTAVLP